MEEQESSGNIYEILSKVSPYWKKVRWYIPICLLLGLLLGGYLYYDKSKEAVNYYGKTTFMMSSDDVAGGNGIASSLGVMLPGGTGGGNKAILLELLQSNRMLEKTLLTKAKVNGDTNLLINHFIDLTGYRNSWKGDKNWESYSYPTDYAHDSNETRDGFLRNAAKIIAENYAAKKTDAGIFEISFFYTNKEFAKAFLDNLIITIIDYYTEKKTAKARVIYNYAKQRHDDLYAKLNGKQRSLAKTQDKTSEFVFIEDRVPQMRMNRDIEATSEMFQEASMSLEAARMSLVQETPYVQVIDDVRLPLVKIEPKPLKMGLIGFAIGLLIPLIIIIGVIIAKDFLRKQKEEFQKSA